MLIFNLYFQVYYDLMRQNNRDGRQQPPSNLTNFNQPLRANHQLQQNQKPAMEKQQQIYGDNASYDQESSIFEMMQKEQQQQHCSQVNALGQQNVYQEDYWQHQVQAAPSNNQHFVAVSGQYAQSNPLSSKQVFTSMNPTSQLYIDTSKALSQGRGPQNTSQAINPSQFSWQQTEILPNSKGQPTISQSKANQNNQVNVAREYDNSREPEQIEITFFCYHQCLKEFSDKNSFWIEIDFPLPIHGKDLLMNKIDDDIIMGRAFFYKNAYFNKNEIQYRYHLKDKFTYSTDHITRGEKQQIELTSFFDTPRIFRGQHIWKNYEAKNERLLSRYFQLIMDRHLEDRFPGDPQMIEKLAKFFKAQGFEFYFNDFFDGLLRRLYSSQEQRFRDEFKKMLVFSLQTLHYLFSVQRPNVEIVGKNLQSYYDLINFLAKDSIQDDLFTVYDELFDDTKEEQRLAFEGGLKRLIAQRPNVGILFLNYQEIFQDVNAFIEKFTNIRSQGNVDAASLAQQITILKSLNKNQYNSEAIQKLKDKTKQTIIRECKSFADLLKIEQELEKVFDRNDIYSLFKTLKSNYYSEKEIQEFICENFNEICKYRRLKDLMLEDIKRAASQSFGLNNQTHFLQSIVRQLPQVYTPQLFIQISKDPTPIARENIISLIKMMAQQQLQVVQFTFEQLQQLIKNLAESVFKAYLRIIDAFELSLNLRFFCTERDLHYLVADQFNTETLLSIINSFAKKYMANVRDENVIGLIKEFYQCKLLQTYPPDHISIQQHLNFINIFNDRIIDVVINYIDDFKAAERFLQQIFDQKSAWRLFTPHSLTLSNELFSAILSLEQDLSDNEFWDHSIFLIIAQIDCANEWNIRVLADLRNKILNLLKKINNLDLSFKEAQEIIHNNEKPLMKEILSSWFPKHYVADQLERIKTLYQNFNELATMYEGFLDWVEVYQQVHRNELLIDLTRYREELENLNKKKETTTLKEFYAQGSEVFFLFFSQFKSIKQLDRLEQSRVFEAIFKELVKSSKLAEAWRAQQANVQQVEQQPHVFENENIEEAENVSDENSNYNNEEEEKQEPIPSESLMQKEVRIFSNKQMISRSINSSQKLLDIRKARQVNQSLGSFKIEQGKEQLQMIKLEDLDKEFEQMLKLPQHIKELQQYHSTPTITIQSIKLFWSNFEGSNVQECTNSVEEELNILNRVYNIRSESKAQLISDFKYYHNREQLKKDILILLKMKFLLEAKHDLTIYNKQEQELKASLELLSNITDNLYLSMISEKIQKTKIKIIDEISTMNMKGKRDNISAISILEQVVRSKELYEFALSQRDVNFNDLYERLDDTSFLTTSTITDMNSVVTFFINLEEAINRLASEQSISVKFLASTIYDCLIIELHKDSYFNLKLKNCIDSLHALKVLTTANFNQSENSQRIVKFIMSGQGIITIFRERSSRFCEYRITYMDESTQVIHINNEDLMRHQNRLLLILRSQKQSDHFYAEKEEVKREHENFEKQVQVFAQMLTITQDITNYIQKLHISGHLKYNDIQASYLTEVISQETILDILNSKKSDFEKELFNWKEALLETKFVHYYLTYVPNMKIKPLIEFFEKPSSETLQCIQNVFTFINPAFDQASLLKQMQPIPILMPNDITNKQILHNLGEALNHIFSPLNSRQKVRGNSLFETKNSKYDNYIKQLLEGERIYRLQKDIDIIKAIISVFAYAGVRPRSWNILFCTQSTMLSQIENFVLRSHTPQDDKIPFIIANYDELPLSIQFAAYNFIVEKDIILKNHLLLIFFKQAQQDIGTNLIEELHGQSMFTQILRDDQIRSYIQDVCKAKTVVSNTCGVGKSQWIKNAIEFEQNRTYIRILISGQMTTDKFIKYHDLKQLSNNASVGIHYDIYPTSDINASLFQAMILQTIISGEEVIYHMPHDCQFYLEISHNITSNVSDYIFGYFPKHELTWNLNNLQIDLTPQSRMQILCKFMRALEVPGPIQIEDMKNQSIVCSQNECLSLLNQHYISKQERPNLYLLNSFILFASDQLQRLLDSPYFMNQQLINDQFNPQQGPIFYRQIVETIISLSSDLAQVEASQKQQDNALNNIPLEELQVSRLEGLRWENSAALFIMINESGSITPIFKESNDLPDCMKTYFKTYRQYSKDIEPFEKMSPEEVIEKVSRIFAQGWEQLKERLFEKGINFDFQRISFTRDNFLKLALIYLRIRVGLPVIVMGETGVGKTAIINYLADVLLFDFKILNVHAGITEDDIENFITQAQLIANENDQKGEINKKVILFFDEINTNVLIQGLLKEIVIDKHFRGEPLHHNICMVAACNPYQLRAIKQADQNWDDADRNELGISAGIQHISFKKKLSNLVYTVQPLPESVFSFIWDYGSLSISEEQKIIQKIISTINNELSKIPDANTIIDKDLRIITECVCHSQMFTRSKEAKWAVSLRDVARFAKLFCYFVQNNARAYGERENGQNWWRTFFSIFKNQQLRPKNHSNLERAFVLSLCFCYMFRIAKKTDREQYIREMVSYAQQMSFNFNQDSFMDILEQEYLRFLDNMEIPKGIGKNTPLKENIFVIFTCIMNKIPLIITGKPGSTKTLAMNLVIKSMKGSSSNKKFFKSLPAILQYSYQGSLQSTSDGIKRIFEKAIICQENITKKGQDTIVLVIFDEIGLAEISPHNPLKVLHSLLEHPKVAVVGISNWALDASKMNRAITLSRPDPDKIDLIESAKSINEQINSLNEEKQDVFNKYYLQGLVNGYFTYYKSQRQYNFHGLRDFYSLIQYICTNIEDFSGYNYYTSQDTNEKIILKGIERNFGGSNIKVIIDYFAEALNLSGNLQSIITPTKQLLLENIQDKNSRHLMVITPDNEEDIISSLENILKGLQQDYRVFQGSDFPEDTTEESAYRLINEITLCMERGITCVLQNLSIIYQSFYDMLNQNYQVVNDQYFCKVAIGSDSTRCLVHSDFKCIVIATESEVKRLDPPLLNRFEKQKFAQSLLIESDNDRQLLSYISKWVEDIAQVENFEPKDIFPVQLDQNSLLQLVIQSKMLIQDFSNQVEESKSEFKEEFKKTEGTFLEMIDTTKSQLQNSQNFNIVTPQPPPQSFKVNSSLSMKDQINFCKNKILRLATLAGIKRIKISKEKLCDQSLADLSESFNLENYLRTESRGSCSIVYTFQTTGLKQISDLLRATSIELDAIKSRVQFETKVQEFFSRLNESKFLMINATSLLNSNNRINLCKTIVDSLKNSQYNQQSQTQKRVLLIIKLADPSIDRRNAKFKNEWDECLIEVINGKGRTDVDITQLLTYDLTHLYNNESVFNYLVQYNIAEIMSKIKYDGGEEVILERIDAVKEALKQKSNLYQAILTCFNELQQVLSYNNEVCQQWQEQMVMDKALMRSKNVFHSAAIEFLSRIFVKNMSFLIMKMESDGLINAVQNKQSAFYREPMIVIENFRKIFKDDYLFGFSQMAKINSFNFEFPKSYKLFPFITHFHSAFNSLQKSTSYQMSSIQNTLSETQNKQLDNASDEALEEFDNSMNSVHLQLKQQIQTIVPASLNTFDIYSEQSFKMYFADFALIVLSKDKSKSQQSQFQEISLPSLTTMKIMKLLIQNFDGISVADLYAVYWNHYQCIQDVVTLLENCCTEVLSPQEILEAINLDDTLSQHIQVRQLQNACFRAICNRFLPTAELMGKIQTQRIALLEVQQNQSLLDAKLWEQLATRAQNYLRSLTSFKSIYCKESKTLDFMILISKELVTPYNLRSNFLPQILVQIGENDPSQDPDTLIQTIIGEIQELQAQNEDETVNLIELEIAMARFLYEYLEDRLDEITPDQPNQLLKLIEIIFNMVRYDHQLHEVDEDEGTDMQPRACLSDERFTMIIQSLIQKIVDAVIRVMPEVFALHYEQGQISEQVQQLLNLFDKQLFKSDEDLKVDIEHQIPIIFIDIIERILYQKQSTEQNRQESIFDRPETLHLYQDSIKVLLDQQEDAKEIIQEEENVEGGEIEEEKIVERGEIEEEEKKEHGIDNNNNDNIEDQSLMIIHTEVNQNLVQEQPSRRISLLNQVIAIANFRGISKVLVTFFAGSISKKDNNAQAEASIIPNSVVMAFNDLRFIFEQNIENERAYPLKIYFLKLLQQHLDINQYKQQIISMVPWLQTLNLFPQENYRSFNLQLSANINQEIFEVISNPVFLRKQLQQYNSDEIEPQKKLVAKLSVIQHFYFNGLEHDQNCRSAAYEVFRPKCQGDIDRDFLGFYISGNASAHMAQRASEIVINKGEIYGELIAFLGTCVFSSDPNSFISRLVFNPESISEIYVPFLVNTRDDFKYQTLFQAGDQFIRYRCKGCREIYCVVDCGALSNHRGAGSSSRCAGCNRPIGYEGKDNSEKIDRIKCTLANFKTDSEAVKSYIRLDPDEDNQVTARDLNPAVRRFGQIFLHVLLAISFIFGSRVVQQKLVQLMKRHNSAINIQHFEQDRDTTLNYLINVIDYMWQQSRQSFYLSNTQMLQLMEYIGSQMFIRSSEPAFSFEQLKTIEGRKGFEKVFQEQIFPNLQQSLQDNFTDFFKDITFTKIRNRLIEQIDEVQEISMATQQEREVYKFTALRQQSQISVASFRQFLSSRQGIENSDYKFIALVQQYQNVFEYLHLLQPILSFGIFVMKHFNGKVQRNNAYDNSIRRVIEELKLNHDLKELSLQKAEDFCKNWSTLASQLQEISEACDAIKIEKLTLDSKFQYCCLTNMSKDSLGFHFFLVLRYLAQKQNEFLKYLKESLPELFKDQSISKVRLLELTDDQILMQGKENFQQFITNIIDHNSFSDIHYGQGRQINYNAEKIAKKLKTMILHNKVIIDYDFDIKFLFQGSDEDNNLYEWYEFLTQRIPQELNPDCQLLVNMLGANKNEDTNDSRSKLLQDLTITMSFLCQAGGHPEKSLETYMKAFNIHQQLTDIKNYPSLRLKHVLDLYEKVENSMEVILIERTQPKYRSELTENEYQILRGLVKDLPEQSQKEQIQTLRRSIGLLCIRQLSTNQSISEAEALFQYLFNEMNIYLFGIYNEQNMARKLEEMQAFQTHFEPSTITIGQAFHAYQLLRQIDEQIQQDKRENEDKQQEKHRANIIRIQEDEEIRRREEAGGGNIFVAQQPVMDMFQVAQKQQQKANQNPGGGGMMMKSESKNVGQNSDKKKKLNIGYNLKK